MAFTSHLETDVFGKSTVTITQRPRSSSAESISVPGGDERRGRKEAAGDQWRVLRKPVARSNKRKVLGSFLTGSPIAERGLSRSSTAACSPGQRPRLDRLGRQIVSGLTHWPDSRDWD
jgi:hypothetical protein